MNDNRPTFPGYGHYQPRPKDTTRKPALADNGPDLLAENERPRELLSGVADMIATENGIGGTEPKPFEPCAWAETEAEIRAALAGGRGE